MKEFGFMKKLIGGILLVMSIITYGFEINIKIMGAAGDGIADDSKVILSAVEKISANGSGKLFFPKGTYRFAQRRKGAVHFTKISNINIEFEAGTVLLMDNLQKNGKGGGHGILITGPCRNVNLKNVYVKWKYKPSARSMGDGFRFEGFPSDDKTIANITMNDCRTENAPQTGAVLMGCSDIKVNNFISVNTLADGLHFNACRRIRVNKVTGINNGDDSLAFVTYYSKKFRGKIGSVFCFPEIGEWSNSDSVATGLISKGGMADGMRISGGINISVSDVSISGKWGGIQLDSALTTIPENRKVGWSYLASKNIRLSQIQISKCSHGFIVRSLHIKPDLPDDFWKFDLKADKLMISDCKELGIDVQNVAGVDISQVETNSPVQFLNARGKYSLTNAEINDAAVNFYGIQGKEFYGFNQRNMETLPVKVKDDLSDLATGNIHLKNIALKGGTLNIEAISGLKAENLSTAELKITRSKNNSFDNVAVYSKGK